MNQTTDLLQKALDHYGTICLPKLDSIPTTGGVVSVVNTIQPPGVIKFDSCTRVSSDGSIVDFVVRKGAKELLVGVWPNGYTLTPEQIKKIESAGKSYIAILGDFVERDNVKCLLETSTIPLESDLGTAVLHISFWVYHARHGWYYDYKENKIRD